ncbi:serine threonine protein kinase : Serine/threonine protein kinase OS=Isosphaera pallida (strain ATCC 43644 / DSM 9630 / IS1B) GN=Isop_2136 PE=3 SV=1: Pkinase: FGE-sulfatase [Gemmata massiliana]|uniref:Protein kinase domain-containing protein n=1 Tax=Gemmata massiliana TaxID=1210884 RepID=A0A6P2CS75_9BACT|nr:SUMF1/EgtB/PvdO family nonheme iron enzyme [Gemmata massiliana]VTR91206.1 serine threonine protein kinase : Serine/threonine protein kinase OS=Isosphaera pallida (strain ATCC 43644 / DSM 9630 / IS1B) GN=Isop_2136 PE=3 SV=1: Pkinase: FGE-sulfatase [Gemmata massiliana]
MPRLQALLECVGQALCEKGRKALQGLWPFADVLPEVARAAFDYAHKKLPGKDLRTAIADCAAVDPDEYERRVGELIAELATTHAVPKAELADYLRALPVSVRQSLRRPSDAEGHTVPEQFELLKSEEFAVFLPPRIPRFRPGDKPTGLDDWTLTELRGLGQNSEVWRGEDPNQSDARPVALKFVIDSESCERVKANTDLFTDVFDLNDVSGVLPLRGVYLETDPPCLEAPFVDGYDLAGLMFEWKWRYDSAKPEAALKLIRRLTAIVAKAQEKGVIHRDLKPSNVLLRPTEGGKFTMWVSDYGWGQIESVRALEIAKGGPRGEQLRLAHRGAATSLYACPQQVKKELPALTDDVHAIGVIWYQLLKRDPSAPAPFGAEWIEELRHVGFTDSQASVLQSCLCTRPDKRPKSAAALAEALANVTVAPPDPAGQDGSKLISLKNSGSSLHVAVTTARGREYSAEAAAGAAAAMLAAAGGGPLTSGGPGTSTTGVIRLMKNSIGMTFVRVPAGTFRMGDDTSGRTYEGPVHTVKITRPFYMSVVPVTQAQYEAVKGKNPSKFSRSRGGGLDHPVDHLTWDQAFRFCDKLARMPEEEVHRRSYRLPTEAEWEYACRAGSSTDFACGDRLTPRDALYSTSGHKQSGKSSGPVAQFPANAFGLHDMHGNVQEWVNDWFDEYYYFDSPHEDPPGPKRGQMRVIRGGCWGLPIVECRSAARRGHAPESPSEMIGFRVVMEIG